MFHTTLNRFAERARPDVTGYKVTLTALSTELGVSVVMRDAYLDYPYVVKGPTEDSGKKVKVQNFAVGVSSLTLNASVTLTGTTAGLG